MPAPISSQTPESLSAWLNDRGEKPYRATQILKWIHQHFAPSWEAMSNLPGDLQGALSAAFDLSTVELARKQGDADSTQKFLWKLRDHQFVESVLIPASPSLYGEPSDRQTLCISTQVGCAYGCTFCASGLEGFKRNLESAEIIDQVLAVERAQGKPDRRAVNNLVIMGMGEPLANYENLMTALSILNADWGTTIGARKITISTSGLVPQIRQLAAQPRQYRLAISLHGATDAVRDRIMPINRKYPLADLTAAAEDYQQSKSGKLTLEYILIGGINDHLDQVGPLAELARRLCAKVNLIPYNHVDGLEWERPDDAVQDAFYKALVSRGALTTLRREKGHNIDAACGQLRLRNEKELADSSA